MKNKRVFALILLISTLFSCAGQSYGDEVSREDFFYSAALDKQGYLYKCSKNDFGFKHVKASSEISTRGSSIQYSSIDKDCGHTRLKDWMPELSNDEKNLIASINTYTYERVVEIVENKAREGKVTFFRKDGTLLSIRANQYVRGTQLQIETYIDSTYTWDEYGHITYVYERTSIDLDLVGNGESTNTTFANKLIVSYTYGNIKS